MSPPLEGCGHSVPKPFYCREWVFAKVAHILDNRTPDKIQASNISGVLLTGEPGAGKTALCSELLLRHHQKTSSSSSALTGRVLASHFINAYQPETQSVSGFIRRIVGEISRSELIHGYAEKLRHPELSEWLDEDNSGRMDREPDEAFQRLVLFPLLEIDTPARNLLLVVDSLDEPTLKAVEGGATSAEQDSDTSQSIAELLANHHHLLPPWLLLFLSLRRSNKPLCRLFTGFKKIALDQVKRGSVVRDVQQYILSRLEKEPALRRHLTRETAPSLNMLHIKSHGCLLYVEAVLDGVSDGSVLLRDIPEIPGTLNGLYLWLCQRLFTRRGWIKVQPLLALLLAARRPTTQEELYRAAQTLDARMTKSEYRKRMQMLRKLLVSVPVDGRDGSSYGWTLFHSSFGEWLSDVKHCTQRFLVKSAEGHARWAVTLAALGESMDKRDVEDLTFHLGRMQPQGKLEAWHLPLWLLWTKAPLPDTTELQVMVSSLGAAVVAASQMELSPDMEEEEKLPLDGSQEPELRVKEEEVKANPVSPIATEESIRDCESSLKSTADDEEEEDQEVSAPTAASVVERRNSIRLLRPRDYSLNESDDPEQTLFYAAQMGYTSAVSRLCTRYRSSISSAALRHALSIAARQGHAALVSILLEAGADPDVADSEGWTPLRASAWGGHASTVQVLLERGAQVDACDSEGRTALRAAAWAGHEEVVRALLNAGAQVDGEDRQGRTPLIAAAYMGHADIVTALLDAGAKPDHVDGEGRTALSVAVLSVACRISNPAGAGRRHSRGKKNPDEQPDKEDSSLAGTLSGTLEGDDYESVETVTILLEYGACVNHQDKEGMTPLLVAAFEGHRMMCELLLEAEADVDQADSGGRTPILAAASMGHSHIVELLLFWGCYVDSIDAEGRTVLSVAAAQGSVEVVRRLLDRGLDEAHRDNTGWTPLHYAAYEGHPVVVDLLMEVGARPDAVDNDGRTPILLAAQEGHTIVVEKLIAAGSDVNQTSLDGKSPLRSAALESHLPVLSALIQAGADVSSKDADGRSTLYLLAIENKVEPAEIILKAGHYDLDKDRDLEGRTPLHIASWQGKSEMVELLLRYGADVNSVDREQRTPLQSSAWQGHEKVVWLLLKAGARCDQPCAQGATPLSIAAQEGHEEVARLLLASGADPNRADGCGRTALKLAMKGGHKKVIQLLENWTSSLDSASHPATNNSRLLLSMNGSDLHKDYSTASTFETGSGKSSSNLTSSSTPRSSSQRIIELNPVSCSQQSLSFTQQLQKHAGRPRGTAGLNLPLSSRILTPLSEPQSPLYSSPPPPTPPGSNNMLIITDPPVWQPLNGHRSSKFSLLRNKDHRSDGGSSNGSCGTPPLPQRTSSVDPDRPPSSPSTSSVQRLLDSLKGEPMVSRPSSVPPAQSSHMQIILGPPSKSRRNGFGHRPALQQSVSRDSSHHQHNGGGFSGLMAGIRNSALLHGSTKLKNALCNAVGRAPAGVIKKETQL